MHTPDKKALNIRNCEEVEFDDIEFSDINFSQEMIELTNPKVFTFKNTLLMANTNINGFRFNYAGIRIHFSTGVDHVSGRFDNVRLQQGSDSWPTNWPEIRISGKCCTNGNIVVQGSSFTEKSGKPHTLSAGM